MPKYQRGDIFLHYEQRGSGFPLLLLPPGGMNATIDTWQRMAFNPVEILADEFRVIAIDQRNAGASYGPLGTGNPWDQYAEDHVGLMNHLGIERCHVLGCCIGASYALNIAKIAPKRVASLVLQQPIGIDDANRQVMPNSWKKWAEILTAKRPDLTWEMLEDFGKRMWSGDFVLSVSRDFVSHCNTPMLILPGNDLEHSAVIAQELAALAPKAETLTPWKEPADVVPSAVAQIRRFLRQNTPKA
ncbi:MAG TPA: alpha/beta fold hydrolase [Dongiaceae bacterium]|jgi:pimeloyl-ACP methyl ester carboxylesterase|nr:alpha/beta fold hydrolase [Dongiaceae bacterium]